MVSWLRLAMACLLALAIPLQGFAAAAMTHCDAAAQRPRAGEPPAPQVQGVAHHQGTAHVHVSHAHTSAHTGARRNAQAHAHAVEPIEAHGLAPAARTAVADPTAASFANGDAHKCSACGSCCAAAALPSMALVVPEPPGVSPWQAAPPQGRVAHVTGGLERPPRPILA